MGSTSPTSKLIFLASLFLLSLLLTTTSSSSHQPQPRPNPAGPPTKQYYQVFRVRNTKTFFLDNGLELARDGRDVIKTRKNKVKNFKTRPNFSVMLPKGFVPPSGSSPCHNDEPSSQVAAYCDFSDQKP